MSTPRVFNSANKQPVTLQQDEPTIWQADAAKDGDACVHTGHLSLAADVALESPNSSVTPWQQIISL